jgi:hypothetical protein
MSPRDRLWPAPSRAVTMRLSKHPAWLVRFLLRCPGVASTAYHQPGFVTNIVATAVGAKVTR